jgi:hypothetical protein
MITCTFKQITIADLFNGFVNNEEEGVYTHIRIDGELIKTNIRPPYQREFVYSDDKRNKVIETLSRNLPLGVVYLAKNADGTMEVIDGQQRIMSICLYLNGDYSVNGIADFLNEKTFNCELYKNTAIYKQIMSYNNLLAYIVEGDDDEKLDWFKTINISGEKLTDQELLNANYTGEWLCSAKRKFSKTNCVAYKKGNKLVNGTPIRQDYLETALSWVSGGKENIAKYMAEHQFDENAEPLWDYFVEVIEWVEKTFTYRKEMKGIDWGKLYREYGKTDYDVAELEEKVKALMADDDVNSKKGIYEYVLSNCSKDKERHLSIRKFSDKDKRTAYEKQNGICPICGEYHTIEEMEGDHIVAWSKGGKTTIDNLQMLCKKCNREKSNI